MVISKYSAVAAMMVAMLIAVVAWLVLSYWPAGAAALPTLAFGAGAEGFLAALAVATLLLTAAIPVWIVRSTLQPLRQPATPALTAPARHHLGELTEGRAHLLVQLARAVTGGAVDKTIRLQRLAPFTATTRDVGSKLNFFGDPLKGFFQRQPDAHAVIGTARRTGLLAAAASPAEVEERLK